MSRGPKKGPPRRIIQPAPAPKGAARPSGIGAPRTSYLMVYLVGLAFAIYTLFEAPIKEYGPSVPVTWVFIICFFGLIFKPIEETLRNAGMRWSKPETITAFSILGLTAINQIVLYAIIFKRFGITDSNDKEIVDTWDFIYFSIVTWTTPGYGDMKPTQLQLAKTSRSPTSPAESIFARFPGIFATVSMISANIRKKIRQHKSE
jgi:hypothetical protein